MTTMFLTDQELTQLTGKARPTAQRRELVRMGIKFRVNSLGRPVVCRSEVETGYGRPEKKTQPDLEGLRALQRRAQERRQKRGTHGPTS